MSLRSVVLCGATMLASLGAGLAAVAQPIDREVAQAALQTFDIAPQPLSEALIQFGRQAGLQVSAESSVVGGMRTGGVRGTMSRDQALTALLAGTGLVYRINGSMVALERPGAGSGALQIDPVQVQAALVPLQAMIDNLPPPYPGGQVARGGQVGLLGERDVMNTPFNQSNYTAQVIENQQARSIADVVANDPSVRNAWPAVSYTSPLMVRGFPLGNQDLSFNGMYGAAPALTVTPEYLERVEVLKGTSAMLNGMAPFGSIGGSINLVPKHAAEESLARLTANYFSSAQVGGHVDLGHRFGPDKSFGIRVNGVYRNGNTPVDRQTQEIIAAVIGMDYRGDSFRATLDYGYQKQNYNSPLRPTYVAAGIDVPLAPGGRANWFQPWTFVNTEDIFGVARVEYDLAPNWTIFAGASARTNRFEGLTGFANVSNANGNLIDTVATFPSGTDTNSQEVGIRGRLVTGPISHALSLVGTRLGVVGRSIYTPFLNTPSNLYLPTFVNKPNVSLPSPPKVNQSDLTSVALADVLSAFDDRVQLIVGGRYQRVKVDNFSNVTGAVTSSYDQSAVTPGVGFIVKPWQNVSIYGNYMQGLQQGPTAPAGTTNAGQMFAPLKSTQFELGAKVDFGQFAATLALFQIEQPAGLVNPATATFSVDGIQRNRGLELNVFGEPLKGFRTLGGISLIDGVQVSTASALTQGKKATGVPDVQLNLGAEWDASFLRGLTFSGRVIYTSAQYLDPANTQSIPAWTRFDAGVRYSFERPDGKPISIRFNVENLFDLNYWASANSTYGLSMGAPRTFLLSLSADF